MDMIQVVALLFIGVGVPLAWYGVRTHHKHGARYAAASTQWSRTQATVTDAGLIDHETTDSDGDSSIWYEARLLYRYTAEGAEHVGAKAALCARRAFSTFEPAQQWLLAHSPGTTIDAWYDPANPADSAPFLDKPSLLRAGLTVLVGIGFVAAGVAMLIFGF